MEISVSILNSIDRIKDTIKLNNTSCDYLHIDVMDGKFVPNKQFSVDEIKTIISNSNKKIDIHLMVEDPYHYIKELINYNIEYITIHYEIEKDLKELIKFIKENSIKVGLSVKPNTKISNIIDYLEIIDLVLIMSVEPGYGGQSFIENSLDKVKELKEISNKNNLELKIEIDGGVKDTNIKSIINSGVDISVVGSYITKSLDFEEKISKLK